jgi:hypothetical protein
MSESATIWPAAWLSAISGQRALTHLPPRARSPVCVHARAASWCLLSVLCSRSKRRDERNHFQISSRDFSSRNIFENQNKAQLVVIAFTARHGLQPQQHTMSAPSFLLDLPTNGLLSQISERIVQHAVRFYSLLSPHPCAVLAQALAAAGACRFRPEAPPDFLFVSILLLFSTALLSQL